MKQVMRKKIENFLQKEGYKISILMCSEDEIKINDCWIKGGTQKIKLKLGVRIFQFSQLSSIIQDKKLLDKFISSLK